MYARAFRVFVLELYSVIDNNCISVSSSDSSDKIPLRTWVMRESVKPIFAFVLFGSMLRACSYDRIAESLEQNCVCGYPR